MDNNDIPFNNINREDACSIPRSSWAEFHLKMMGVVVLDKITDERLTKVFLWHKYKGSKSAIEKLTSFTHRKYIFLKPIVNEQ